MENGYEIHIRFYSGIEEDHAIRLTDYIEWLLEHNGDTENSSYEITLSHVKDVR